MSLSLPTSGMASLMIDVLPVLFLLLATAHFCFQRSVERRARTESQNNFLTSQLKKWIVLLVSYFGLKALQAYLSEPSPQITETPPSLFEQAIPSVRLGHFFYLLYEGSTFVWRISEQLIKRLFGQESRVPSSPSAPYPPESSLPPVTVVVHGENHRSLGEQQPRARVGSSGP